jgi:hypothetical protein
VKALFLCALLSASVFAATPAIGIVTASGHFTLQGSEVWGNATLFEGATIETTSASSQLALRNGVKVQLAAGSRAHVFADRLTLERGVGQVASAAPFEIDAAALRIQGAGVRVGMGETVEVAALTGVAKVSGKGDLLLATIPSGRSMSFAPQAAQTGAVKRNGCLLYKDNHFILQDDNTQEVVELNGQDLAPNLGNRVAITGTASTAKPAVSIAASVMNVSAVAPVSQGGCLVAASSLDARTEMPQGGAAAPAAQTAAKTGGMSTGAKVAIAAVIIGGGAAAGIAVLESSKKSTSQ